MQGLLQVPSSLHRCCQIVRRPPEPATSLCVSLAALEHQACSGSQAACLTPNSSCTKELTPLPACLTDSVGQCRHQKEFRVRASPARAASRTENPHPPPSPDMPHLPLHSRVACETPASPTCRFPRGRAGSPGQTGPVKSRSSVAGPAPEALLLSLHPAIPGLPEPLPPSKVRAKRRGGLMTQAKGVH